MNYLLMNKDRKIALIDVIGNNAIILEIYDNIPNYIMNLNEWLNCRTSPVGRKNIEQLCKLANIHNKDDYYKITHCISLSDTFWVKEVNDKSTTWNSINPYTNKFNRIISEIALNFNVKAGNLKSPSPDYSVDGSIDKCWKRENGQIRLYKTDGEMWSGNNGKNGIRPFCEYYANQVAQALISYKNHYVKYNIKVSNTKEGFIKPYVYSNIFTSEKYSYLPYGESKFRGLGLTEFDNYLSQIKDMKHSRMILREMLVLDAIILNCDRHTGNYGFLVNNDTFKIESMAPIFDQDCSLGYFISMQSIDSLQDGYEQALNRQPRTDLGDYVEQAKLAMTKSIRQRLINMYPFKFKRLPDKSRDLSDNRIKFMEYIINTQIKRIVEK